MNRQTLLQRLKTKVSELRANKSCQVNNCITGTSKMLSSSDSLHSWSNISVQGNALQRVVHPCINATDFCAVAVDNTYDFPKEGLSSIPKYTDLNVLSMFPAASVARSNSESSSKSFGLYFRFYYRYHVLFFVLPFLKLLI